MSPNRFCVSPISFKTKYTAVIDINPGNIPSTSIKFMSGFRILNLSLDKA